MRINIYAEEITLETEVVIKKPENHPDLEFYGIRCYLASPNNLHSTPNDDDRSAITFWVPWTKRGGYNFALIETLFEEMLEQVRKLATDKRDSN